jgi:hypothetical protein
VESTIWSILGSGYGSLGQALIGKIHAEAPTAGGFGYHNGVGDPLRVSDLVDELGFLELLNLLDDEILLFWCLTSGLLLHGAYARAHR